jgi:thiamine biosynthesis lipoprotein
MIEILRKQSLAILFLCVLLGFVMLSAENDRNVTGIQQLNGYTMGTSYQIQLVEFPDGVTPEELATGVEQLLTELDTGIFSTYAASSELSRFNRHGLNTAFVASARLLEVLLMAQEIAEQSDGAFDITVGPLVNLWGFGPTITPQDKVPDPEQIDMARESIGYQYLDIDPARSEISKRRDLYVDLSAIAKGYAVDQVAAYLDTAGVESYFLEIGGELKIKGLKPGNESWVPAIEAPLDTESRIYEVFFSRGENIAVAGSGDYRNYFEEAGVRYSHEIDPRSGRPIAHNLAAAYVIDESAARADALATTYMVLGLDDARNLAKAQNQAVYFIFKQAGGDFDEYVSDEFSRYLLDDKLDDKSEAP